VCGEKRVCFLLSLSLSFLIPPFFTPPYTYPFSELEKTNSLADEYNKSEDQLKALQSVGQVLANTH
jgi:hypothetical protein